MGNHKFRLSDMLPKTWFYKLKHMTTNHASSGSHHSNHHKHKHNEVTNQKHKQSVQHFVTRNHMMSPTRKSYYFTRTNSNSSIDSFLFPDHTLSSMNDRSNLAPPPTPTRVDIIRSDRALPTESLINENVSWSSSFNYEPRNIVIDIDGGNQLAAKIENSEDFVTIFDLELRPILTKPKSTDSKKQSVSKGLKMRKMNSPRIINYNRTTTRRKSVSSTSNTTTTTSSSCSKKSGLAESLAIVKRSKNPKEDFKKSMVEMIVEHEIKSSKELEELLACYLSLNSDEYHDLIISVFKQIWFQISNNDDNMMMRRSRATTTATVTPAVEIISH